MRTFVSVIRELFKIGQVLLILFVGSTSLIYLTSLWWPGSLKISYHFIVGIMVLQAGLSYWYTASVFRKNAPKPPHEFARTSVPKSTFIVAAYLPNEVSVVENTILNILQNIERPASGIEVILAYNTPHMEDVELRLREIAFKNPELILANAYNSRSKSENLNYTLELATGEIVVILDADHLVSSDCLGRAWRWLEAGYDVVQGRCKVRNSGDSFVSALVGVEFEIIYGIQHPSKTAIFDTSLFGGSNGYWKSSVIKKVKFREDMLTEDIDSTARGVLMGYKFIHDRTIVSSELAPTTIKGLWFQRKRWSQGWFQCSLRYQWAMWNTRYLSLGQKFLWTTLLSWRVFYDVITTLLFPVLFGCWLYAGNIYFPVDAYIAFAVFITLFSGPFQSIAAYKNASQPRSSVFQYINYALWVWPYTIFKTIVHMVSICDELSGERSWIVSKREKAR